MSKTDKHTRLEDLGRIKAALNEATRVLRYFTPDKWNTEQKGKKGPVTAADRAVNQLLLELLPRNDEGWLSEETSDESSRLSKGRVWVVDPIDGTLEFVAGIPEWCVSIGLVEDGRAVAGGICNPAADELLLGSIETGISWNGKDLPLPVRQNEKEVVVLASRSEVKRGEWDCFQDSPFTVTPMGSVAYKLGRVAAGLANATWTLVPKHEWDVAAGVALVTASGGIVKTLEGTAPVFNRPHPRLNGLLAFAPGYQHLFDAVQAKIPRTPH